MHLFHCWHNMDDSTIKIYVETRCRKEPLQPDGRYGQWKKCCICEKEKLFKYRPGSPD